MTLEGWGKVLEGTAALLWPALVGLVLFRFAPAVRGVIESARTRRFTVKVGGQELTMEEASAQQRSLIADLQTQVLELRKALPPPEKAPQTRMNIVAGGERRTRPAVLWVDDQPRNNSYLVQQVTDAGIEVDLALTTGEALARLERQSYRLVISDVGRIEDGQYVRRAGLDLVKAVREGHQGAPIVLYTSTRGADANRAEGLALGAALVTGSPTELLGFLRSALPEWRS